MKVYEVQKNHNGWWEAEVYTNKKIAEEIQQIWNEEADGTTNQNGTIRELEAIDWIREIGETDQIDESWLKEQIKNLNLSL